MDRRRKRVSSDIFHLVESGAAGSGLSGVARDSKWPNGPTGAHRDNRADGLVATIRMAARQSKLRSYAGPESWHCHFRDRGADAPCALERRWFAAALGKPLSRGWGTLKVES